MSTDKGEQKPQTSVYREKYACAVISVQQANGASRAVRVLCTAAQEATTVMSVSSLRSVTRTCFCRCSLAITRPSRSVRRLSTQLASPLQAQEMKPVTPWGTKISECVSHEQQQPYASEVMLFRVRSWICHRPGQATALHRFEMYFQDI